MTLFDKLLPLALEHWTRPSSRIHGVDHWTRVATFGHELAAETPGADIAVVQAFAAFHDCQRVSDGRDPDHGRRAAALVQSVPCTGLDQEQTAALVEALAGHADGTTTTDPTIGACWDADRLDLRRLGRPLRPELLSTDAARSRCR